MEVLLEPGYERRAELEELFTEYTDMLLREEPAFQVYLDLQHYGEELDHLQEKYGPPGGRLYLARVDGAAAGCVAIRRLDDRNCELKRLYVRPAFRGCGLAGRLVDRVLADAEEIGYQAVLLDTFPFLQDAIRLYKKRGFREVSSYNGDPMPDLIYLRLELQGSAEK